MLVTDTGNDRCSLHRVGDNFKILVTILPFLSPTSTIIYISVGHQNSKDVTKFKILSPTSIVVAT